MRTMEEPVYVSRAGEGEILRCYIDIYISFTRKSNLYIIFTPVLQQGISLKSLLQ